MNEDAKIIKHLSKVLGCSVAHHVGDGDCRFCNGTGFRKISLMTKLRAFLIERIPWNCIRKEVFCDKCTGGTLFERSDGTYNLYMSSDENHHWETKDGVNWEEVKNARVEHC